MSTRAKTVPWPRDPHTAAKHAIYRRYLHRWFPILLRGYGGDVTYAEGFAGPGVYSRGEPGSPVIALNTLLGQPDLRHHVRKVRLLFVDDDPRCTQQLGQELQTHLPRTPLPVLRDEYNIDVRIERGRCEPTLVNLLDQSGAWGRPMLVVLDTFGGAVSAGLLRRIASNTASEVVVTIQPQYFLRFAAADVTDGDTVFGNTDWRRFVEQPTSEKARWLLRCYRETVRASGFDFVLDFELVDVSGQSLYLVFGTNHRRGLEKMKEVMWEVDDASGVRYVDPLDPDQQQLEIEVEPQTAPLRRLLLDYLTSRGTTAVSVHALREFTLFGTVFKPSQVRAVLQSMVDAGDILVDTDTVHLGSAVRMVR